MLPVTVIGLGVQGVIGFLQGDIAQQVFGDGFLGTGAAADVKHAGGNFENFGEGDAVDTVRVAEGNLPHSDGDRDVAQLFLAGNGEERAGGGCGAGAAAKEGVAHEHH